LPNHARVRLTIQRLGKTVGCENLIRKGKLSDAAVIVDETVQDIAPFDLTMMV